VAWRGFCGKVSGCERDVVRGAGWDRGVNEVSELSADVEALPVKVVAEMLAVPVTRVHQHVRDGLYLSFRRDGVAHVPADFFDGTTVVKGLQGTIVLMRDGGFADPEILRWLFTEDDSLSGSPIASLRAGRHREVKRRAQAMAF
jgi:hypothetical protein